MMEFVLEIIVERMDIAVLVIHVENNRSCVGWPRGCSDAVQQEPPMSHTRLESATAYVSSDSGLFHVSLIL